MATLQELTALGTLNICAYECSKQSYWKETTQRYLCNVLLNNLSLQNDILSGNYKVSPTTNFYLNERGKIRHIEAPAFRDRIVQKTLMKSVLTPSLTPYIIYDNYASIKMRGTTFARKRFEIMLKKYYAQNKLDGYMLMIDIKKYFDNIDHEVLKQIIAPKLIKEPQEIIDLIHYIIDSSSKTEKGLNLGSEAPQILAIYYLNPIDHFVKVVKGIKYYGRYMDDIFIIGKDKKELKALLTEIVEKLSELKLEINQKKTHIVKLSHGFTYLQVKCNILPSGKILKRPSHGKIVRERRRLKAFRREFDKGIMTEAEAWNCYQSWRGTVIKDHNACKKTIDKMDELYRSLFPTHEETEKSGRYRISYSILKESNREDIKHCLIFN